MFHEEVDVLHQNQQKITRPRSVLSAHLYLRSLLRAAVACCWLLVSSHSLTVTTRNPCSRCASGFYEARNSIATAAAAAAAVVNVITMAEDIIRCCASVPLHARVWLYALRSSALCCSLSFYLCLFLCCSASHPLHRVLFDTKRAACHKRCAADRSASKIIVSSSFRLNGRFN